MLRQKKEILKYAKKQKTKKFKMTTKDILTQLKDGRCNENLFEKLEKEGFPGLVLPGNRDTQGNTALILAVKLCPSEELYYYLPFDARNEKTVDELQRSTLISKEIIGLLLERGAHINAKNSGNETALSIAVETMNLDIVNLLLERGAKINMKVGYDEEDTVLIIAVKNNDQEMVALLLQYSPEINAKNYLGDTALLSAVKNLSESEKDQKMYENNLNIIQLLLQNEASSNVVNKFGENIFDFVDSSDFVVQNLLKRYSSSSSNITTVQ